MTLKGKTALVTGSNGGLGKAFVAELAKDGANVIAQARKDMPEFRAFLAETAAEYAVSVVPVFFDLLDSDSMKAEVRKLVADKVPLNVLVNCAGMAHGGLFQMTSMAKIREVFDVNLFAHMELTQALFRYMIRNKPASIINLSSLLAFDLPAGECAYGVSKAALAAFTKTLAAEGGPLGVRVNAVAPGLIDTPMAKLMTKDAGDRMVSDSAMKRLGLPEEVAKVVAFLASDDASFVNGQIVKINGGRA